MNSYQRVNLLMRSKKQSIGTCCIHQCQYNLRIFILGYTVVDQESDKVTKLVDLYNHAQSHLE